MPRSLLAAGGLWLAAVFRLVHLFNGRHLIVSPDSYFFHFWATRTASGQWGLPARGSGLTYIVGGLGRFIGVDWAAAIVPLGLSVLAGIVVYQGTRKMYGGTVALFSLLAFAVAFPAVFIGAAGNIDRDCLHLLLIPLCMLAVYFMRKNILLWGSVIAVSCVVLWYEWGFYGPLVVGLYALPFVMVSAFWSWRHGGLERWQKIIIAAGCIGWTALAIAYWGQAMDIIDGFGGTTIGEMQRLDGRELLSYLLLIPFMMLGMVVLFRRKDRESLLRADVFLVCWLGISLLLGMAYSRMHLWGIPAFCILAGIGLAWLWEKKLMPRLAMAFLVLLVVVFSGYYAWNVDLGDPRVAATQEYQQAMKWLGRNAADDERVLAWWDWGYMIQDLSGQVPVMDNGYWEQRDIVLLSKALWSADDDYAAYWIARTGASWLVLYYDVPPPGHVALMAFGSLPSQADLDNSLMKRAFTPGYHSDRLPLAYRSPNIVILRCYPCMVSG